MNVFISIIAKCWTIYSQNRTCYTITCFVLYSTGVAASSLNAQSFSIPDQGARAAGQGKAFAVQADDPTAIYYNPAGLAQQTGTEVLVGGYALQFNTRYNGTDISDTHRESYFIPHFYAASDLGTSDWRVGLGVNNSYGLGVKWDSDGPLGTTVTSAKLAVLNVAPTVSYRISDQWSVGGSINVYRGEIERKARPLLAPGVQGDFKFDGSGWAIGATIGVLWKPHKQHGFAVVYRSPFTMELSGNARLQDPHGNNLGSGAAEIKLHHPQRLTVGYAFRPNDRLKLEFNSTWSDWTRLRDVPLVSSDPFLGSTPPEQFHLRHSFSYRIGAEYQVDPLWSVRAGYGFFQSASPDRTFTPLIPDLNSHAFSAGFGYATDRWGFDVAYQFILRPRRNITESVNSPPGSYRDHTHGLMASITLKF